MSWRITTRAEAEALRVLLDAAHGPYPKRGAFTVAPGKTPRRVPVIPDAYSPGALGWTAHHVEILDDPANPGTSAVFLPPVDNAKEAVLTGPQRAQLAAARAAAVVERPAWTPALMMAAQNLGSAHRP